MKIKIHYKIVKEIITKLHKKKYPITKNYVDLKMNTRMESYSIDKIEVIELNKPIIAGGLCYEVMCFGEKIIITGNERTDNINKSLFKYMKHLHNIEMKDKVYKYFKN